ncbi:MAG: hypothetical protein AB8C95_13085 [Phycisphaeraceae bacterium]
MSFQLVSRKVVRLFVAFLVTGLAWLVTSGTLAEVDVRGPILTWHDDPTTEVTVTWLELGDKVLDIGGASDANQWWEGEAVFGYGKLKNKT